MKRWILMLDAQALEEHQRLVVTEVCDAVSAWGECECDFKAVGTMLTFSYHDGIKTSICPLCKGDDPYIRIVTTGGSNDERWHTVYNDTVIPTT